MGIRKYYREFIIYLLLYSTEESNPEGEISDFPIHCDSLPPIKIVTKVKLNLECKYITATGSVTAIGNLSRRKAFWMSFDLHF